MTEHTFKLSEFVNDFQDLENDKACKVLLTSHPTKGFLFYKGIKLNTTTDIPFEIEGCDVKLLRYEVIPGQSGIDSFSFHIIDSNINNPKQSNMALFTINIGARPNQPPSSVGDNTVSTAYATAITITSEMLTTQTTPAYADPENDAAFKLKVLTLPSNGSLILNSTPVTANQEILFSAISAGQLKFTPSSATITAHSVSFTFAISDVGSQQFTS